MRVAGLTLYAVRLPLRRPVRHASAQRQTSENLFVCCRLADGTTGWGEGVPRTYVTGESIEGAFEQWSASELLAQCDRDCTGWPDVVSLCQRLRLAETVQDPRGAHGNALRCAIELSILDAFGRLIEQPVSAALGHVETKTAQLVEPSGARVRYSGVITSQRRRKELSSALKIRCYGLAHCKIKVGLPDVDESDRLRRIRRFLGSKMDMRLDANEAWSGSEVCRRLEPLLDHRVSCVEQPVAHEEVGACAELRQRLPVQVMLDESLASQRDAAAAIRDQTCDLFNIRLSKCGGMIRSLQMADAARQAGLHYQLGCHPGESPILSAAGRHWAGAVSGIRYLEGSYDRHVLNDWPTHQEWTFGYGGWAPAIAGPGLGTTINSSALDRLMTRQHV